MTIIPGLGVIPGHWSSVRARRVLARQRRPVRPSDDTVTAFRDGQVTLRRKRRLEGFTEALQEIGYHGCRTGDLVVHAMDGFAGAIGVAETDGKVSPVLHLYRSREGQVDLRFVAYVLRQTARNGYVLSLAKGIRERSTSFDPASLADVALPVPPLEEQRRIADFLDDQVALLDRAVELRQRQIALAKERRLAEVTGVYEDALRAEGGVRLGLLLRCLEQGWSPQCEDRVAEPGEYGVLKAGCVNGGIFRPDQHKALPSIEVPRLQYLICPGNLLMSRASGSLDLIGSAAVVPHDSPSNLILCDKVYRLRLLPGNDAEFIALMLASRPLRGAIKMGASGAAGMANNVPSGAIRRLAIPALPLNLQQSYRNALLDKDLELATTRGLLARSVELLAERKRALIAAAVTGQFDVTTARAVA